MSPNISGLCPLLIILIFLSGCQTLEIARTNQEDTTPPPTVQIEQKQLSPLEQHLQARKKAKAHQESSQYTQKVSPDQKTVRFAGLNLPGSKNPASTIKTVKPSKKPYTDSPEPKNTEIEKKLIMLEPASGMTDMNEVTNVRFGTHPDKTRMVFDMENEAEYTHHFDKNKKRLTITLPKTTWSVERNKTFQNHDLLQSYTVNSSSNTTIMTLDFKAPSKLILAEKHSPNNVWGNRIVFDMSKDD